DSTIISKTDEIFKNETRNDMQKRIRRSDYDPKDESQKIANQRDEILPFSVFYKNDNDNTTEGVGEDFYSNKEILTKDISFKVGLIVSELTGVRKAIDTPYKNNPFTPSSSFDLPL